MTTGTVLPPPLTPDLTREEALRRLARAFTQAGLDTAALDACILLLDALGIDMTALVAAPHEAIGLAGAGRLARAAQRRLAREPVGRILGEREFWGLPFRLAPATLEPRPDTETLVAAVLDRLRRERRIDAPLRLLDLGTGTGCILVALLAELPAARGIGVDRAAGAAATAQDNARRNGVGERAGFVVGDWAQALAGPFDVLVSNPPYIETGDLGALAPEVRNHDPALALDGGADGLDAYRVLAATLPRLLAPGGLAAFEVGAGQAAAVAALLAGAGCTDITTTADLAGVQRVVAGKKPGRTE